LLNFQRNLNAMPRACPVSSGRIFDNGKQQGLLLGRLHCQLIILFCEFLFGCAWHNGEYKGGIDASQTFNHEDCFEAEKFIFFGLTTFHNTRKQTHLAHPNHILIRK